MSFTDRLIWKAVAPVEIQRRERIAILERHRFRNEYRIQTFAYTGNESNGLEVLG